MKLHLPSGLRKALMACLAAVAFALPSTLSSASLPAGALVSFVLAQQVTGAEETVREGDEEEDELDSLLSEERAGIGGIMPVAEPMPLADTTFPGPEGIVWSEEEENIDSGTHNITGGNAVVTQTSSGAKNLTTSAGTNLKINKDNAGRDFQLNGSSEIHSTNVWVTHKGLATAQAGTNLGYVYFNGLTLGSEITDFWINGAGINFDNWKVGDVQRGALSANFHIGTAYNTTSGVTPNSNAALFFQRSGFVTTGYLEAVEAATVFFRGDKEGSQGAACIVHFKSLKSAEGAVLTLASNASTADMASTLVLDDSTAVSEYKAEQLNFNSLNIDGALTIQIANGKKLEVKGLSGQYAKFAKEAGEGTATVKLVGKDAGNSIANVIFGENVTLELGNDAVQTFTGTSSVSKLTGAGTLNIGTGSVSIAALDNFTGTISAGGLSMKSLQLEGGSVSVEVSGGGSGAGVNIETGEGGKLTFGSAETPGLTLTNGQQLTLSGGTFSGMLTLNFSGAVAMAAALADVGGEGYITQGEGVAIDGLTLKIEGLDTSSLTKGEKIQIFTEGSDTAAMAAVKIDSSSLSLGEGLTGVFGADGALLVTADLTWEGSSADGNNVWSATKTFDSNSPWGETTAFKDGDAVTFNLSGGGATVTVEGEVKPSRMTLKGTGGTFTGTGTIIFGSEVVLERNASYTISSKVKVADSSTTAVMGQGKLTLAAEFKGMTGATLIIGNGSDETWVYLKYDNGTRVDTGLTAIEIREDSTLQIGGEGINLPGNVTATNPSNIIGRDTKLSGGGTVVLYGGDVAVYKGIDNLWAKCFYGSDSPDAKKTLAHLIIGTNDSGGHQSHNFEQMAPDALNTIRKNLRMIEKLEVCAGSSLIIGFQNSVDLLKYDTNVTKPTWTNTLILNGTGKGDNAAFQFVPAARDDQMDWNLELGSDATIGVTDGGRTYTVNGAYDGKTHTLTTEGAGTLKFAGSVTGLSLMLDGTSNVGLGTNGGTNAGTIASLSTAEGEATHTVTADAGSTWTITQLGAIGAGSTLTLGGAGNFAITNEVTLSEAGGKLRLEGTGSYIGSITLGGNGKLYVGSGANVGGLTVKITVTTENADDPFYFLDPLAAGSKQVNVTVDGLDGNSYAIGWSNGKMVVNDKTAQGDTTVPDEFTGPTDVMWADVKPSGGGNEAPTNKRNFKFSDGENQAWKLGGTNGAWNFTVDSGVKNLKFIKGGFVDATPLGTKDASVCSLENLWLTNADGAMANGDDKGGYFDLLGSTWCGITDIWVNNTALAVGFQGANTNTTGQNQHSASYSGIVADRFSIESNLHLGSNSYRTGLFDGNTALKNPTLYIAKETTTTGYLEMVQSALVVLGNKLTVASLKGAGDLRLAAGSAGENGAPTEATLSIGGASTNFTGHLDLVQNAQYRPTIELKGGITLTTAGILGGEGGGTFTRATGEGAEQQEATVQVKLHNPDAVQNVVFGEGVTLEILETGSQALGANSSVSKLTGEGALGVSGAVTVQDLSAFTGAVHMFAGGALTLGKAAESAVGSLSSVVLRGASSGMTLNNGAWTLKGLSLLDGVGEGRLNLSGAGEATTASVVFGDRASALELKGGISLGLGSGITGYSGTLKVKGSAEKPNTLYLTDIVESLSSTLRGLKITLDTDGGELGLDWTGFQLFSTGDNTAFTDEQLKVLDGLLKDNTVGNNLKLGVRADGTVYVTRGTPLELTWQNKDAGDEGDPVWKEGDNTQWKHNDTTDEVFAPGDKVVFEAIDGKAEQTVTVDGSVHTGEITVKDANYTFNGRNNALVNLAGDLTVSGTDSVATFNVAVKLSGGTTAEAGSVTKQKIVGGEVTFKGITGNDKGFEIGDGSTSTTVHFTDKKQDGTDTRGYFGAVEVKEGSKLVIDFDQNSDAWGNRESSSSPVGGDYVYGNGTVVLHGGGGTAEYAGAYSILRRLFDSATESDVLDTLEIENINLSIKWQGTDNGLNGVLEKHLKKFVVKEGSTLGLKSNYAGFTSKGAGMDNTLYLDGGALNVAETTVSPSIGWDIVVSGDATILTDASGNDLNITGTLKLSDDNGTAHKLTKTGSHALNIDTMVGVSTSDKTKAGSFDIQEGTVSILGLADPSSNNYVAQNVTVTATNTPLVTDEETQRPIPVAEFAAGTDFTVGTLSFAWNGDEDSPVAKECGAECITNAVVSVADGATLTIGELDLTASNGTITGSSSVTDSVGTIVIEGFKTDSGHSLRVGWAGEHVKVTLGKASGTFDLDGGLYLANGNTVTLASDGSIGWLGGNTNAAASALTSGWNDDIGGTITTDVEKGVTLTLNGVGKKAGNYTIQKNVKLLIDNSSDQQTFISSTINGDIEISANKTLAFEEAAKGDADGGFVPNTIGSGSELSGSGTLKVQNSKLKGNTVALTWNGQGSSDFTGMLEFAPSGTGVASGTAILQLENDTLSVGGIVMTDNGELTKGTTAENAKLTINVARGQTVDGKDGTLTVGGGVTLNKTGEGTQKLKNLTATEEGAIVQVGGGTLEFTEVDGHTFGVNVNDFRVNGNDAQLKFSVAGEFNEDEQVSNGFGNITLSNGGTLSDAAGGGKGELGKVEFAFGSLTLEGRDAKIVYGQKEGDGGANKRYSFTSLSGTGTLHLDDKNLGGSSGRWLSLGDLTDFSGTISGSVADGNHLYISGNITTGTGSGGSISLTGGAVELSGKSPRLQKTGGAGTMTISHLKLAANQELNMHYAGGALSIQNIDLQPSVMLYYTENTRENLVTLDIVGIKNTLDSFAENNSTGGEDTPKKQIIIHYTGNVDPEVTEFLYLGITGDSSQYSEDDLEKWAQVFVEETDGGDAIEDGIVLEWEEAGDKDYLKISLLTPSQAYRYWDSAWGIDSSREPSNKDLEKTVEAWRGTDLYGKRNNTVDSFTQLCLELSGADSGKWQNHRSARSIRIEPGREPDEQGGGSSNPETLFTIIGGKLYSGTQATGSTTVEGGVYLSLWANATDYVHIMAGGSSFASDYAGDPGSFEGDTHIQVQGGTVDYLIGGNHLSSNGARFEGNTYISVYEGGRLRDPESGELGETLQDSMRSAVRGGIVGGSTITNSVASEGTTTTYDFVGDTHINIYTVLQTARDTLAIEGTTLLTHIVGGNAWIVPEGSGTTKPTFAGSSEIVVDLSGYQHHYEQLVGGDVYDRYSFLKGIVGGNYSAGDGEGERSTVFLYQGSEYGSHITITGHSDFDEGHDITFYAGVNGASRTDTTGTMTTDYTGSTLVEIDGGRYVNYVAGGFWFGGATQEDNSGQVKPISGLNISELTGSTNVKLASGTFWRVTGGSVNRFSLEGSEGTQTGDSTLTIEGGNFTDLSSGVGIAAGGSYYEGSHGTYEQIGAQTLTVGGGVFTNTRLVGGDYAVLNGAGTSLTVQGDTNVTIDGATITGIVIGGGYMEDEGTGGSLTITGSTNVTINGGKISAKDGENFSDPGSGRLAIVAGSMLVDTGTSGGHTLEIGGDTNLTINGGTITGYVVGGSYSSSTETGTGNSITLGRSINVNLNGGTITGNVIGGHYSNNTTLPSSLALGNVTITLGGEDEDHELLTPHVNGYIFGGSYRRAQKAADTSPTQGAIEIRLLSGSVAGGVYAAGNHLLVGENANLRERTASTKIVLTGDVTIEDSTFQQQAGSQIILSGGYQRGLKGSANGTNGYKTDYSTVGYDEKGKSWNENAAVLELSNEGQDNAFSRLQGLEALYLQDLDTIDVNEGLDVKLEGAHMRVMHKVTGDAEVDKTNHDTFTKGGKGNLTLGTLWSWHAQEESETVAYGGKEVAYTGKIILGGGTLTLTGGGNTAYEQSLEGGLMINMNERPSGNADQAYLKGTDGTRFTGLGHGPGEGGKIDLELVSKEFELGGDTGLKLATGVYYLVDGLDLDGIDLKTKTIEDYFNLHGLDDLVDKSLELNTQLAIRDDDKLVLRVYKYDKTEWRWDGGNGDGSTWAADSTTNFTKEELDNDPSTRIYYFDAGAADGEGKGEHIDLVGNIVAAQVIVESGNYTFKLKQGTGLDVNTIQVGISDEGVPGRGNSAELTLAMSTKRVDEVLLEEGGVLTLAHDKAIQKKEGSKSGTQIVFHGGTLAYGEDENGLVLSSNSMDHSAQVSADSEGPLRIRVGNEEGEVDNENSVTWTGLAKGSGSKEGIRRAVEEGIIKSGRMNFTLDWELGASDNYFTGTLDAEGGTLTLKATPKNAGKDAVIRGDKPLTAAEGATVELIASSGGSLTVARGASGEGTIAIGSASIPEKDQGSYVLSKEVSTDFTGTIRLAGNAAYKSVVTVNNVGALGRVAEVGTEEEEQDSGSTLTLAGRAITLAKGVSDLVEVQNITVEGLNYVGGYSSPTGEDDPNKTITLSAAGSITGKDGDVLANAKGGYAQTLKGDLSKYEGAIVAGHATSEGSGESTWTLEGELKKDGSATIAAGLAGTGKIIVNYAQGSAAGNGVKTVRLTGAIGDSDVTNMGSTVGIVNRMEDIALVLANSKNTSTGSLIFRDNEIWLGDDQGAARWMGGKLEVDTDAKGGTFRLRNGELNELAGGITEKGDVKLIVDTAQGGATVNVGKTKGSLFDEININAGGKLRDVTGDITVGEGKTGMHLIFTKDNLGSEKGNKSDYLIESTGRLIVNDTVVPDDEKNDKANDHFSFDLTNEALFIMLMDTRLRELQAMEVEGDDEKGKDPLANRDGNTPTYLHLLDSSDKTNKNDLISFASKSKEDLNKLLRSGKYTGLLEGVGFTMSVDGGDLLLLGSSLDIYIVLSDKHDKYGQGDKHDITSEEDAELLSGKKATLLDEETGLVINFGEVTDVTVNNLVGLSGSRLTASGGGTVTLNNARALNDKKEEYDPMEDDQWLNNAIGGQAPLDELKGQDTEFEGSIEGKGKETSFVKKGAGTLTVGKGINSGLRIDGTLTLANGSIVVHGDKDSHLGTLAFDYEEVKDKDGKPVPPTVGKGFGVDGGMINVHHIVEGEDADEAGKVTLSSGGVFVYAGAEEGEEEDEPLVSTTFTTAEGGGTLQVGAEGGEGVTLTLGSKVEGEKKMAASIGGGVNVGVNEGSKLKLQGQATMEAGQVELTGTLDMSELDANPDETNTASVLHGTGTLAGGGTVKTKLTITGRPDSNEEAFSGTLAGSGTLSVAEDAVIYFDGLSTGAIPEVVDKWNLDVVSGGTLDVKLKEGNKADLGNVTLQGDSNFVFRCNGQAMEDNGSPKEGTGLTGALKVAGEGDARANLTVDFDDWKPSNQHHKIVLGGLTWDDAANGSKSIEERFNDPKITGRGAQYFSGSIAEDKESHIAYVNLDHEEQNMYKHANQEKNAAAGADIFWGIDDPTTRTGQNLDEDGDLYQFTYALGDKYQTSGAGSELDRMLTAGAGASIAVLGQALGDDLHRQLNSLRNRTTGMGSEARYDQYDMLPLYHMWVNGETGYHKLDADGLAPGYTLNSWGGTLGMEIDVSRRVTVGLALTAMYGDLKTDATDSASGDMDTTYMSAFVRGTHGAWSHTLVVSGGMADVKFNRTVGYDAPTIFGITMPASYKTSGSTDGYMVGAIYELGYTRMANAAGTVAIQPVFNVEIRHVGIQGYNETGSDAGLRVGDITQDTVTIGLGARVQALTGTNIFNRSAIFEGRALLKADVGDRSGKVVNAVLNTQNSAELESAEVGAVGVEIGAGISIPLGGTEGSIFIDGSLEWRSGYTSMDATIGYRVNF